MFLHWCGRVGIEITYSIIGIQYGLSLYTLRQTQECGTKIAPLQTAPLQAAPLLATQLQATGHQASPKTVRFSPKFLKTKVGRGRVNDKFGMTVLLWVIYVEYQFRPD
jgi:hypothetical protein